MLITLVMLIMPPCCCHLPPPGCRCPGPRTRRWCRWRRPWRRTASPCCWVPCETKAAPGRRRGPWAGSCRWSTWAARSGSPSPCHRSWDSRRWTRWGQTAHRLPPPANLRSPSAASHRPDDLGIFGRTSRFWVKKGGGKSNRFPMAVAPIVVVDGRAAPRARRGSQRRWSPMRAASRKIRFDWAQKAGSD